MTSPIPRVMLVGGDSHHFAVPTGPGRVWLQSMPITSLAATLSPYLHREGGRVAEAGIGGGILGDILRG